MQTSVEKFILLQSSSTPSGPLKTIFGTVLIYFDILLLQATPLNKEVRPVGLWRISCQLGKILGGNTENPSDLGYNVRYSDSLSSTVKDGTMKTTKGAIIRNVKVSYSSSQLSWANDKPTEIQQFMNIMQQEITYPTR